MTPSTLATLSPKATMFARRFARVRFYSQFKPDLQPRLRIGSIAPDFNAQTTKGPIKFHEFLAHKWTVLFSHPADFTPVCTTELGGFAKLQPEFEKLGAQLIGLSADSVDEHQKWISDIEDATSGGKKVDYPIIADTAREVAYLYNMVDEAGFKDLAKAATIRNVFIIDPNKVIRLFIVYPASVGRNVAEILRVVRALQTTDKYGVATPEGWTAGQDVIVPPSVSTEDARKKFGAVDEVKSYLRYVKVD